MVPDDTSIRMYAEHKERTFRSIKPHDLIVWLGGGILNPMGPTLTVTALEEDGSMFQYKLIHMMINPFTQWVREVGELTFGRNITFQDGFAPVFSLSWGSCPSLLLPQKIIGEDFSQETYARLMHASGNGQKLLAGVRKYPNNPIDRLSAELKQYQETGQLPPDGQLAEEEALELAALLCNEEALNAEMSGFIELWRASIELVKGNKQIPKPMSIRKLFLLYSGLQMSCRY